MWKITYDHTEKKSIYITSVDFDEKVWDALPSEDKVKIKLYDDDHNLYYDGVYNDLNEDEEKAFEPLDWATGYAGCTYMKYKCPKYGEWRML